MSAIANGRMKLGILLVILAGLTTGLVPTGAGAEAAGETSPALLEKPLLYEVVRHLYRWYLDELDAEKIVLEPDLEFWIRELHPPLDPGDRSQLGLIVLPALDLAVKVKRAEYEIPELKVSVKNEQFKIINVDHRGDLPSRPPEHFEVVKVKYSDMRDYLFKTRNQLEYPEGEFLNSLRLAVQEEIREEIEARDQKVQGDTDRVIHFSSLSPVANELWVFWEAGRVLLRIASDIDLANPAMWKHGEMAVKLYDIDEQVVVSLDEVTGSNAYMTRDQVGRALFNCIVLGRRVVLEPLEGDD